MFRHPSIQARLSVFLTLIILATALISGVVTFYTMFEEAEELQDDMLKQAALLTRKDELPEEAGYTDIDNDTRIYIQPVDDESRFNIPHNPEEGFFNITDKQKKKSYRAYIHRYEDNTLVAFIQETEFRDDVAFDSAWFAVLPLLTLVPVAVLLTMLIIHLSLRPISRLSEQAENRKDNDFSPLSTHKIPMEIYGFTEAINHLLHRVGESIRQQQRFIADAAHELRSPMTALSLQAERLSGKGLPEDTAALVEDLREGIGRNRRLLEQLLSMARAQAHENRQPAQNIHLAKFCQKLIQDLYPLAEGKNIDLGADCESVNICVDETEIYTLLKTLLENAILYTPENGQVDLTAKIENGGLRLEVEDNGPGIPLEERERVFDPFYRVLGSGTEGSGLGLSIAKTIAERYGGTISLSDSTRFEHGLKVSIWLPQECTNA
ncbi:MAG: ATP-binding protein [Neisseria zoodegmatis]|uniref:sensor histidine kinase n=1 Tax=Neisseria zoodegmatis TaxID=326523 RepID=UPI0026E9C44F|nr:ATP-binding protein [Neisseria zoodegmatis]MDO5068811.1 ATP-binding protein [Neisseria zoodegmatis]